MSDVVHLANVLGRWLVAHLGRLSLELVVLAAVVLAVIQLLRVRSPRLRHLFWCLVLAKPVVTFLVASPVSLYWFFTPPQLEAPPVVRPAIVQRAPARPTRPLLPYRRAAPPPLSAAPVEQPPWWAGFDAYGAVALVWAAGAAALALRLTVGFAFVSFLRHTAVVQSEGPLPEAMARAGERLGVRRGPRVALSSVVHGPVLAGILRPVVLLPQSVHERCTMRQVEMVLAHEAAHARRLDNLALLVQRLAEVVLFVHPVVWLCGWAMRREAEAACDYAVVEAYGDSAAYADSLTRVAEMRAGLTRKLLVNTFAAAESNLRGRVRRIVHGRLSGRTLRWTVVSVAALLIVAGFGLPTAARKAPGGTEEKKAMHDVTTDLKYGFRKDPMDWVETDGSLQGALVRTLVFGQPHEGDSELIEAEVDEVLAAQLPDGRLSDDPKHSLQFTSEALIRLARMGCPADRPEVKKAVEAILGKDKPNQADPLGIYDVRALCMLGLAGEGEYREFARRGLRRCLAAEDEWGDISEGCPWTPIEHLITLYHGRAQVETEPVVRRWVQRIADNVNAAGCWSFKDPWGFVRLASEVEGPEARELLTKEVPLILRSQRDDGGWGDKSLFVFGGLKRHGLLESLRERPPLPASWRVVRSIPAPKGNLGTMTWLDGALYVVDWESGHLLALSPEDGSVVRRLPFPDGGAAGVGRWGGSLAVTQGKPRKRLLKVNPRTGAVEREVPLEFMETVMGATEVDGRLWVADGWIFPGNVVDPDDPSTYEGGDAYDRPRLEPHLAGPCPNAFAVTADGVWHTDYFAEAMIKSGAEGKLLDWTERPFGWTSGIAWDGEHLWAIDNAGGRICQIARADAEQLAHDGGGRTTRSQGLDFSKVDLKADDLTHDSFSLSVRAAAGLLGRDVDYETVYVLSTNCFAPGIRPGEPCKRSWVQQARSRSIDLVARGVGLEWTYPPNTEELNDIPEAPDAPWSSPATDAWLREWHRKPMVPHVRRLISEGKVIVSQGEWKVVPKNIGLSWCAWGIITGATDDGEIVGVSVNGQLDSPTDYIRDGHVLSPGEPTLTGREADLAVLERAVHRIRGDADPYRPDRNFVFGLAAMDEWIAQMERPSFQPDCAPDSRDSRESAFATAMTFCSGADVAARWLRGRAEEFSDDTVTHLESAAAHYERCVALLHPALTGDGGEHYREFIGDLEKQKAHADLLRQVKAELAVAADQMEAALNAEGVEVPGSLQHDGGGKSVEVAGPDYPRLKLSGDGWTQETFSLSLVAVARSFGRETSYEEICARSGQAFAPAIDFVNDCKDLLQCQGWLGHLCPMDLAAASVGLEMEPLPLPPYEGEPEDATVRAAHYDACAKVIADALANGDAVIISGGWEFEEGQFVEPWWAGIVTDVRTDGTAIGMHLRGGANCELSSISPGQVFAVRPAAERAGLPAVHRRMLQEAVTRIRARGPYAQGEYCVFGLDAMDEWIRVMRECEGFCPVCQQKSATGWAAAVKNAGAVSDRCTVAASYLRRIAPDFPPEAAGRLESAAAHYDRMIELLTPALTGRGGEHYREFVGDLEKQEAHADEVLADVKAELAAAADDMAAALRAEGVDVSGPLAQDGGGPSEAEIQRLGQWGNIFGGGRDKLLAGAERYPEVLDLLELEASLEPISDEARAVRRHMSGLEPAEWDYADQIEEALAAIAAGSAPAARDRRVQERLEYVEKRRQALLHWLEGIPQSDAEEAEGTDPDVVRLTYSLLGAPDAEKRRLVRMLADKLGPDDVSREDLKGLEESEKLAPFAHRIDMHGYQLWSFDQNHELLLRSIAEGRAPGEWHEPGGPLAWGDGNPDDRPKLRAMLSRLDAWLDGAPDAQLGASDDYKEKEWLARCLALYLRDHLANYYNWYVDETMTANVQHEDGKTWIEGLQRFPSWMTQPGGYVACSRYLGLEHSPAWLYGGSGFAFALNVHRVLCPSGPTAWQDHQCNRLAGNMGLDIEQLLVFSGDEEAAQKREAHFERAREAVDAGLPIIGWEMDIPDYYVVCGYDEDGNYLFRDFDDTVNRIHHAKLGDTGIGVHYLLIVRPGEPAEDDAVVRDALEFALEVAAGQYGHGGEYATGVAGYDQWIRALAEPEAVLEAEASGHGLAYNAACWAECRRYAASFLEEARRRLDREELEAGFTAAVEHYGTVAARLTEVSELFPMNPAEEQAMAERLHDASRREKALVALRAARTAEVAGLRALSRVAVALGVDEEPTQALEEALSSTGEALQHDGGGAAPANVRREDGKVWIEGVPTIAWGESSDTTFVGAMAAALAATDHPYTQNQVMGYSGLAFRVRWAGDAEHSEKGWCPSIPVGEFPEEQAAVATATGWRFDILDQMADEQNPRMERYADRIAAAIEAGLPVVGYPSTDDLNVAVAYGVEGEGDEPRFLWRTYWSGDGAKVVPAAETGPWVMIPVEFGGAPDARRRLLDTLSIAVRNWHREGSESLTGYRYAWGERALQAWREDVRRAGEFTEEQQKGLFFLNWWNFEAWQDARVRAAQFLKEEAEHLGPAGREALLRAAGLYAQEGALLQGQIGKAEAFFGPWSGKGFEDWTAEVRGREQEILARALELERQAIAALGEALQAEGADVPAPTA